MFIVYEGLDNTGKTTQANILAEGLRNLYDDDHVVLLKEPGGSLLSQRMRQLIASNPEMAPRVQGALFTAGMYNTYIEVIQPALNKGKIVILDRYVASTYAYQVWANSLFEFIPLVAKLPEPDLWFYTYNDGDIVKRRDISEDMDEVGRWYERLQDKVKQAYTHMFIQSDSQMILEGVPTFVDHKLVRLNVNDTLEHNCTKAFKEAKNRYEKMGIGYIQRSDV